MNDLKNCSVSSTVKWGYQYLHYRIALWKESGRENTDCVLDTVRERYGPCPHKTWIQSTESQGHGGTFHHWIVSCFFFSPFASPTSPPRAGSGSRQTWNSILAMPFPSQVTLGLNSLSLCSFVCKMDIIIPTLQGCWEHWIREIRWSTWHWTWLPKFTIHIRCYFNSYENQDIFAPLGSFRLVPFLLRPVSVLPLFIWLQSLPTFQQVALSLSGPLWATGPYIALHFFLSNIWCLHHGLWHFTIYSMAFSYPSAFDLSPRWNFPGLICQLWNQK